MQVDVLSSNVLVLNKFYQPVNVTNARRAFGLLYQGLAKAINGEYQTFDLAAWSRIKAKIGKDQVVRTINQTFVVPKVIILQVFDKMPQKRIRFSRQNIYLRDNLTCQYCGATKQKSELNLDHVIPKSKGGPPTWENIVCSCIKCNLRKGGRTPAEAKMKLLKQPKAPSWNPFLAAASRLPMYYEAWKPFLNITNRPEWLDSEPDQ